MTRLNFHRAELIERVDFSKELALFKFRPDGEFSFRPGQYATIAVENGEKLIQRPYSIVSSPYEPFLEFYIELVPHGTLTPRLWDLKVGDEVLTRNRIVGHFTLDHKLGVHRHLMLGTVTGAAPYISMIRTQKIELEQGKKTDSEHGKMKPHQFVMIQGASHSFDFGVYRDELTEIARDGWLTYIPTVSRPWDDLDWLGETGRVED